MDMPTESYNERKIAKDVIGYFTISTILATDIGCYETAIWSILDQFDDRIHPVERCENKEDAYKMHDKWVKKATVGILSITHLGHEKLDEKSYQVNYKNNKTKEKR